MRVYVLYYQNQEPMDVYGSLDLAMIEAEKEFHYDPDLVDVPWVHMRDAVGCGKPCWLLVEPQHQVGDREPKVLVIEAMSVNSSKEGY